MDLELLEKPLTINNLRLEPITERHAELLFADLQIKELYTFIPQSEPKSVADLQRKYRIWSNRKSDLGDEIWLNYAVFDIDAKHYVGTVQATIQLSGHNYIAYEVFPKYQRKGIATAAVLLLMDFMQQNFVVSRFTAHVDSRNIKSYSFLVSLGFSQIDVIEDADYFDGCTSDEYVYQLDR